jgi:hypothetical protein
MEKMPTKIRPIMQYGGNWFAGGRVKIQLSYLLSKYGNGPVKTTGLKGILEMYKEIQRVNPDRHGLLWIFREGKRVDKKHSRYKQLVSWAGCAKPIFRKGGKKYTFTVPHGLFDDPIVPNPAQEVVRGIQVRPRRTRNAQPQGNRGGVPAGAGVPGGNILFNPRTRDILQQQLREIRPNLWGGIGAQAPPLAPEQPRPNLDQLIQEREDGERFRFFDDQQ